MKKKFFIIFITMVLIQQVYWLCSFKSLFDVTKNYVYWLQLDFRGAIFALNYNHFFNIGAYKLCLVLVLLVL